MAVRGAVVDRSQRLQQSFLAESYEFRIGYGVSLAGHIIIALLLMFGLFERIELTPVNAIPVEVVVESPPAEPPRNAPASSPVAPAPKPASPPVTPAPKQDQNHTSGLPAVADVEKHAKAPVAPLNVNGVDQAKQPGHDGTDPSSHPPGIPLPPADSGLAAGDRSSPSQAVILAPVGPAQPQTTTREPGEDELTAIKEQKVECGLKAKITEPVAVIRRQARVRGNVTEAQALAMMRWSQAQADMHINPDYLKNPRVFVETLNGAKRFAVLLPPGLTVNVGDVIQYDGGHIDPSNSCQYIPNLAVSKL